MCFSFHIKNQSNTQGGVIKKYVNLR